MNAPTRMTRISLPVTTAAQRTPQQRYCITDAERSAYGLEGLLPPAELRSSCRSRAVTMNRSSQRRFAEIPRAVRFAGTHETLYYAVLMSDPATYMPIVYTPTVGRRARSSAISSVSRAASTCRSARAVASRTTLQLARKGRAFHRRH